MKRPLINRFVNVKACCFAPQRCFFLSSAHTRGGIFLAERTGRRKATVVRLHAAAEGEVKRSGREAGGWRCFNKGKKSGGRKQPYAHLTHLIFASPPREIPLPCSTSIQMLYGLQEKQDIHMLVIVITPSDPLSPSLSQSHVQWHGQGIQPVGLFVTCLKNERWLMIESTCGHYHSARISCRACRSHAARPQAARESSLTGWPGFPLFIHIYTQLVFTPVQTLVSSL